MSDSLKQISSERFLRNVMGVGDLRPCIKHLLCSKYFMTEVF